MSAAWTAAAAVASTAIAADAQKGGPTSSTTSTAPPKYIAPQYGALAGDLQDIRERGLLEDIQTLSPYERSLVESGMARATAPDPFQAAGEQAVSQLLSGGGLLGEAADLYRGDTGSTMSSPEFMAASQRAVERAMRPVTSNFAAGGRLGSTAFADALADASVSAFSPMALQARGQDIQMDLSRASGLSGVAGQRASEIGAGITGAAAVGDMPFTNIQRGLAYGGLLSGEDYALRQADVTAAQRYSDLLRGATVGSQTTQPLYSPQGGSQALLGAGLMQAAPAIGQAISGGFGGFGGNSPNVTFGSGTGMPTVNFGSMPTVDFSGLN